MPSFQMVSSAPLKIDSTHPVLKIEKYRESTYQEDSHGRYVAQPYEVQPPLRQSIPAATPYKNDFGTTTYSFGPQCTMRLELSSSRIKSKKPVIVAQSCEGFQQSTSKTKPRDAEPLKSAAIPSTPRPRRLSTPELSDSDEERPFCTCDSKIGGTNRRSTHG